jgi:hypothetical protein
MNLKNKHALILDLGLFTEVAVCFARNFGSVKYFIPNYEAFKKPFKDKIGEGLEGVERIQEEEFWKEVDKADMIFVPDITCSGTVEYLRKYEYPVAGVGYAERLEIDRWYARTVQKNNNLPVQETVKIKGMDALEEFFKSHKNYWVKMDNSFRDVSESFLHVDWKSSESRFYYIAHMIGPYKDEVLFLCEEELSGVEPGLDGVTFDGELIYPTMAGYEEKGAGYIGRVYKTEADLPNAFKMIHEGLSPEFKKFKARFFYSVEFKIDKDRVPFPIDVTMRLAAPGVAAILTELITNFSEFCYGLATGVKVTPLMPHKYVAGIVMESSEATKTWLNVTFPKELRQWVKLRMAIKHGGDYYAAPGFDSVCCVIALGNTIKEVVDLAKERAKEVHGTRLNANVGEFEELQNKVSEGKKYGIDF